LVKKKYNLLLLLEYAGELKRYLVNLTRRTAVGKFGVEELVLDTFLLSSIYKLIPVRISGGDSGLRRISLISFFRDLTVL